VHGVVLAFRHFPSPLRTDSPIQRLPALLTLAVFLFAWALEPERMEAFVGRLPYSNYLLKALAKLDLVLPDRKLREP
jgi:hypothetical protein